MTKSQIIAALEGAPSPLTLAGLIAALGRSPGDVVANNVAAQLLDELERDGAIQRLAYQIPTFEVT